MDYPEPGEAWLQYFRRKKQFCCLILLAWDEAEFHIDQLIAKSYGLFYEDKEAEQYTDLPFGTKLTRLKEKGVINDEEYAVIRNFKDYRNRLYHGDHEKEPIFMILSDEAKDAIMDNAVEVAQRLQDIGLGIHGKRSKE